MSILDLMKKYSLPKTTVWHYVKEIKLSEAQQRLLRSRMGAGMKRAEKGWESARVEAEQLLRTCDTDHFWPVLLAALYWSEGTKKGGFVFTNTDEAMIKVFLKILREKLGAKDSDLDILIRTCSPMNPITCRKYWSRVTGISFTKIKVNHDDKQNKSKTLNGMCRITLRKGGQNLKLMHCLIRGLTAKML